jgi:hypothetical protein
VADHAVLRIVELDLIDVQLVAGEVHDPRHDRRELLEPDLRQVLLEEAAAARHVHSREHGAVHGARVELLVAQVARVVKERAHERELGALGAEPVRRLDAHLVPRDQARDRERHVERVLDVVIGRVDAVIARIAAGKHPLEVVEREPDGVERGARIKREEKVFDRLAHLRR